MKVLLLEDVYNLGYAGDVKKVANGYGRNFLLPQGFATLATPAALAQVETIREEAKAKREVLNAEMSVVAEKIKDLELLFPARAGETGKLYGSVTTQMIADKLQEEAGVKLRKRQIHSQPLRQLGLHTIGVRLTVDMIPEISVVVYREGENPDNYKIAAEELAALAQDAVEETQAVEAPADEEAVDEAEEVTSETEEVEAAEAEVPSEEKPVAEDESVEDETEAEPETE
ncbi:MAG: 50S ribosomal protein L9 [Chloroflexi bacterium]|nr:MAG: 50S ribosomal protein L9 [Chloroflexota bacterium]MBL1194689.1 50S ribosomal protein L9 [Chloroflexota bacterium]NOH11980.1 50S ribosomal protein L9 [Chloroflexota bacterium]